MGSPFTAEFLARQQARLHERAFFEAKASRDRAELDARQRAVQPVAVSFVGREADALRRVAAARKETPQALAKAIVALALADGSAEQWLGDARAETLTPGHGMRVVAGEKINLQHCAVVYLIGEKGGVTGWCGWSAAALARLMPDVINEQHVSWVVAALARRGIVERGAKAGSAPRPMRLTELGRAMHAELAGDAHG